MIIIDDFDYFSNAIRVNMYHALNAEMDEVKTFFFESLFLFNKFKMIFCFCPHVEKIIISRVKAINNEVRIFNCGRMKEGGLPEK